MRKENSGPPTIRPTTSTGKKARPAVLPNLKPSVKTISIRVPQSMLEQLKLLANKRDVPFQSLMKIFLAEKIREEMKER
jgi:predicted DNA binding CopG/RHH family protein